MLSKGKQTLFNLAISRSVRGFARFALIHQSIGLLDPNLRNIAGAEQYAAEGDCDRQTLCSHVDQSRYLMAATISCAIVFAPSSFGGSPNPTTKATLSSTLTHNWRASEPRVK